MSFLFSLGVTAEALRMKIDRKSASSLHRDHADPKFQVEEDIPTNAWIVRPMNALHRAGFSLSRALFRKMWGPSPGAADPIFPEKNWRLFLLITVCQLSVLQCHPYLFSAEKLATFFLTTVAFFISLVHSDVAHYFRHVPMLQKNYRFSCGAPFLRGPLFGRTFLTCLNPPLAYNFVADSFHTKRSAILTEIGSFAVLSPLWGLRGNVRWSS